MTSRSTLPHRDDHSSASVSGCRCCTKAATSRRCPRSRHCCPVVCGCWRATSNVRRCSGTGWSLGEPSIHCSRGSATRNAWMYFVHSFAPDDMAHGASPRATTAARVVAAVGRLNVWATQFHPEKSGRDGLHLLRNFVTIAERAATMSAWRAPDATAIRQSTCAVANACDCYQGDYAKETRVWRRPGRGSVYVRRGRRAMDPCRRPRRARAPVSASNRAVIARIAAAVGVPIQVGGGVRVARRGTSAVRRSAWPASDRHRGARARRHSSASSAADRPCCGGSRRPGSRHRRARLDRGFGPRSPRGRRRIGRCRRRRVDRHRRSSATAPSKAPISRDCPRCSTRPPYRSSLSGGVGTLDHLRVLAAVRSAERTLSGAIVVGAVRRPLHRHRCARCRARAGPERPFRAGFCMFVARVDPLPRRRRRPCREGCQLRGTPRCRRSGRARGAPRHRGADELVFLDITASSDARDTMIDVVDAHRRAGVHPVHRGRWHTQRRGRVAHVPRRRRQGQREHGRGGAARADRRVAEEFGAQCVVVAIDARRRSGGSGSKSSRTADAPDRSRFARMGVHGPRRWVPARSCSRRWTETAPRTASTSS